MLLKDFGEKAQRKLSLSRVIVVGAGGLGCPVLQYLTAAGVGTIGLIDDDVVSLENLHRQVLYKTEDIGTPKVICAERTLKQLNPGISLQAFFSRLTNQNALEILGTYDVVVDGTDNFASRYLINDACVLLNKPLVYGAISQYEGQVAVFNYPENKKRSVNYRDLFPEPTGEGEVMNCEEIGVLGVLPGIIGSMQANEAIKIITGIGKPLFNRLITYHSLNNHFYNLEIYPRKESKSRIPKTRLHFKNFDYNGFCSSDSSLINEVNISQLKDLLNRKDSGILDIREHGEIRGVEKYQYVHIPYDRLKNKTHLIRGEKVVVICDKGINSQRAVRQLVQLFGNQKRFYSLKGGMVAWNMYYEKSDYEKNKA